MMKTFCLRILKISLIFIFCFFFGFYNEVNAKEIYLKYGSFLHTYDPDIYSSVKEGAPFLGEHRYSDWGATWGTYGDGLTAHLFLIHYPGNIIQDAFCVEDGKHTDNNYITSTSKIYYGGPACVLKKNNITTPKYTTVYTTGSSSNAAVLLNPATYARIQNEIWDVLPNGVITSAFLHTDVNKVDSSCKIESCTNNTGSISLSSANNKFTASGSYYRTGDITVTRGGNVSSYKITLTNAPTGAEIYNSSNNTKITGSTSASKIYIRVPSSSSIGEVTLKVEGSYSNTCTTTVPTFQLYDGEVDSSLQKVIVFSGDKTVTTSNTSKTVSATAKYVLDTGNLTINKLNKVTNGVIQGAKFELLDANKNPAKYADGTLVGTKTTDANGKIVYNNLTFGTYYLREVGTVSGYKTSTDLVQVSLSGPTSSAIVYNTPVGKITITKFDSVSDKALSGVTFELLDSNKNAAVDAYGNKVAAKTSDSSGKIVFENLLFGTYYLRETKAGGSYKPLTDLITINVDNFIITKDILNDPLGKIIVTKIDEETNKVLSGATFELLDKNLQPAVDAYGNKVPAKTTDANGLLTFENLNFGTYYLKETKNPEGYKVIANPVLANVKDFSNSVTVENTPIVVEVIKRDLFNDTIYLEGATIVVKNVETEEVFTEFITTDEVMKLRFVPGKYILQEVIAPHGYLIYDENVLITVSDSGEVEITSEDDNFYKVEDGKVIIYNEPIKVYISKQDIANSKEIAGAKIVIYDLDKNIVEEFTSAEEAYVFYIKPGKYILEETIAPEGYDKMKTNIEFEIDGNGNIKVLSTDSKYYQVESNRLIIYNVKESILVPDTGTFLSIASVIGGASLLGYGIYVIKKQKQSMQA